MGPNGSLWVPMGPNVSLWVPMDPYGSLCVPMGPYGSLWVPMCPYGSLWVPMGLYGSLSVPMGPYGSLCVPMGFYRSLSVPMCLWFLYGTSVSPHIPPPAVPLPAARCRCPLTVHDEAHGGAAAPLAVAATQAVEPRVPPRRVGHQQRRPAQPQASALCWWDGELTLRTSMDQYGPVWTSMGMYRLVRTSMDQYGDV